MRNSHLSEPFHQLAIHQTCQVRHTPNAIRYIHIEHVHIFPSHILHFAFQTSANHFQYCSGTGLWFRYEPGWAPPCAGHGVKASSYGTLPHVSTEPTSRTHWESRGATRPDFSSSEGDQPNQPQTHSLKEHKRGRICFCL